jgi:hypothetical protein
MSKENISDLSGRGEEKWNLCEVAGKINGNQVDDSKARPPPSLYGETFVHREDTCCGVRMQAKVGKKKGGGALWREKQGKSRFRCVRFCSREKQILTSSRWNGTTTVTVIFEPMKEYYRYFECLNNGGNDPELSRDLARDRTSYEDAREKK